MLLFTDLDRTLLAHDYSVHPRVKQGFQKAAAGGLRIIFVTARAPASLRIIAEELDNLGVCACYNGAWIGKLADNITLSEARLPVTTALEIMRHARDLGVEPVWYGDQRPLAVEITPTVLKQLHNVGEVPGIFDFASPGTGPYKIMCIDRRENTRLAEVAERWSAQAEVAQSHKVLLEIGPKDVSKGTAVQTLAEHLGIPLAQCFAAGDSYNDIPMLAAVGTALTVGNAVPEVKSISSFVAPSCDEGGLGAIIDHLLSQMGTDSLG